MLMPSGAAATGAAAAASQLAALPAGAPDTGAPAASSETFKGRTSPRPALVTDAGSCLSPPNGFVAIADSEDEAALAAASAGARPSGAPPMEDVAL